MITPFLPSQVNIGPFSFTIYGLLIGIAFSIVLYFTDKKYGNRIKIFDYCFLGLFTLIGARSIYVFHNLTHMIKSPQDIFKLWDGGLAIHGALIGGALAIFIIAKLRKIVFTEFLDTIALWIPLGQALGRWGNFFNQELYGKPCVNNTENTKFCLDIPIDKRLPGYEQYTSFTPTFFVESVLNFLNFSALLWFSKNKKLKSGILTAIYLINYGIIRLIINRLRIDRGYLPFLEFLKLDTSDLFAGVGIILGLIYIYKIQNKQS